jgi:hypothetical protein
MPQNFVAQIIPRRSILHRDDYLPDNSILGKLPSSKDSPLLKFFVLQWRVFDRNILCFENFKKKSSLE